MAKFLIEVPHEAKKIACARTVRIFLETGSHFLINADWGCLDGEHKAWIIVEVESKEDAQSILPPSLRSEAKIVRLNSFTMEEAEELERYHEG